MAFGFVCVVCKRLEKYVVQKVGHLGLLRLIPMIQTPINSSFVALQYEPGMKFFCQAVLELHGIENRKIFSAYTWVSALLLGCLVRV